MFSLNVNASDNPPQIDSTDSWTVLWTNSQAIDGWGDVIIQATYLEAVLSTQGAINRELSYAKYEIRSDDDTVLFSSYLDVHGRNGNAHFSMSDQTMSIYIIILMDDGRVDGKQSGRIIDEDQNTYYAKSSNYDVSDDSGYECSISVQDHNDIEDSYVGAAAMYMALFDSDLMGLPYTLWGNDNCYIDVQWPISGDSSFTPGDHIEISSDYFQDDDQESWEVGNSIVRFLYAQNIMYEICYEGNSQNWPDNEPILQGWNREMMTYNGQNKEQWAFIYGFAHAYAAYSNIIDIYSNDFYYTEEYPNGFHLETDTRNGQLFSIGQSSGIKGELCEGSIADCFWDIFDNAVAIDQTPNNDDDSLDWRFGDCFECIDDNNDKTIFQLWDDWQIKDNIAGSIDGREKVFITNGIGRYSLANYAGPSQDGQDNLQIKSFEVLGMDPDIYPINSDTLLIRYIMINTGQVPITFINPGDGIWTNYKIPGGNIISNFNKLTNTISNGQYEIYYTTTISIGPLPIAGSVCVDYKITNGNTAPNNWHQQNINLNTKQSITRTHDFNQNQQNPPVDTFPGNDWQINVFGTNVDDYWGAAIVWNDDKLWCNGRSAANNPNGNLYANGYATDIGALVYFTCPKLMGLELDFDYYLSLTNGDNDFFAIGFLDENNNALYFSDYTYGWAQNSPQAQLYSVSINNLGPAFNTNSDYIKIGFAFISDGNNNAAPGGAVVDNVTWYIYL
jgi:hypothetical protein